MGPFNKKLEGALRMLWQFSRDITLPNAPDSDEAWGLLEQRLDVEERLEVASGSPVKQTSVWFQPKLRPTLALALVVLAVLYSPTAYRWIDTQTILAKRGNILEETLPDGSKIVLNAETRIAYRSSFGEKNRKLILDGEAYFKVQKSEIPFTIHTGDVTVTVVGTEFNVRSRNEQFEVAVNKGVVQVTSNDSTIILNAKQMTVFGQGEFPRALEPLPFDSYPGWTENQFMFHETDLLSVCGEIGRKYDIDIELADKSLESITVTGVIDALDLKSVLSTITFLTQRKYESMDGKIIIY